MYKVLIVDDEELDLKGMKAFIPWSGLGLEVVAAVHSGYEAMRVLEEQQVDILVTDVHMPGMSGLELTQQALAMHPRLRVIFVSGYQDFHYVKQALALHAWDYVLKPMDDAELEEALRKLAQQLGSERQQQPQKEELPAEVSISKNARLIADVVRYVEDRLQENVTLRDVAETFAFSPNYLGALFKEETGINFSEHLIGRRMELAGRLLTETRLRIYEIADRVGYKYMPYFSRQFKETYGKTPNEYRREA